METIEYAVINCGNYRLFLFYKWTFYENEWCWLWDEDKLSFEEALIKYPKDLYNWEEIKD